MDFDFLIIGQGLSGTFLSYYLWKARKKIMVIDEDKPFTASKAASGVINPVTGRRIVRTWRIEELLPFSLKAYKDIGDELGVSLVKECSILDFHPTLQMKEAFENRLTEETEYLHRSESRNWNQQFNYNYDIGEISPCLLVNTDEMLARWRQKLIKDEVFINEKFSQEDCKVTDEYITYKNIRAKKIIFCDGAAGAESVFFRNLPYALNKGEAIIANIPGLSKKYIYKQGISIVPWKDDVFWIGSSYEWSFSDEHPTAAFKEKVINQLKFWLKLPFTIIDHIASVRPANLERRPFVGLHPKFNSLGILNGMGTKGCSLAPFFASQLTDYLMEGKPIYPDADVKRFERMLARKIN